MSLRGVRQLKELVIRYSDWDGSSRGVRAWMQKNLIPFAASNPDLTITALKKRNRHPCITGTYVNGNKKAIGIKNLDEDGVQQQINHLRNQVGRKVSATYGELRCMGGRACASPMCLLVTHLLLCACFVLRSYIDARGIQAQRSEQVPKHPRRMARADGSHRFERASLAQIDDLKSI